LDNVDPVSGIIGAAGLILAAAAFVINGASIKTRSIIAACCIGAAAIGVLVAWIGFGVSPLTNRSDQAAPSGSVVPRPATPPGSEDAADGASAFQVVIVTGDYRRTDESNSTYRISPNSSTLDFRYGWITRTPDGDLKSSDCVVNARLTNNADDSIIENAPSNYCQHSASVPTKRLAPGSYTLTVETVRNGITASNSKVISVLPA
jgi:hypothetical protein